MALFYHTCLQINNREAEFINPLTNVYHYDSKMTRKYFSSDTSTPPRRLSNNKLSLDNGQGESSHHSKQCRHSRSSQSQANITPATTIPRFRKYDLEDFQLLKVLGKGSFGKVSSPINEVLTTYF